MIGRELPYYQSQIRSFIHENKGNGHDFCDRLLEQLRQKEDFLMIDMVCDELSSAFKNISSQVVWNATYLLSYLARSQLEPLTMRMAQKEFQENLVYTLRGKTSLLGNKLTIHPQLWQEIEARVLALYLFWFGSLCHEQNKYHHILEKYRYLKSLNVRFPPLEDSPSKTRSRPVKTAPTEVTELQKPTYDTISDQELQVIDELIGKYQGIIDRGEIAKLLNTETVRMVKGKVTQLYNIFSTRKLEEEPKERIKGQYSKLRAILKKLDQANDQAKLEEERLFLEQKKAAVTGKPLSQKLIGTPDKPKEVATGNLLDEQPAPPTTQSPIKPPDEQQFSPFQSGEVIPLSPEKTPPPTSPEKKDNGQLLFDTIEQFQKEQQLEQQLIDEKKKEQMLIDTEAQPQPSPPKEPVKQIPSELQL